ncbi:DUF3168 domain-containing protein [Streptomyces viridochromogenes]|uniref:DUF3168 domain-containing protein n=1 Tax=Streptomyces viridochromogenes TaxID=1938 RepID=UPI000A6846A9|nr:DUF3168 domain-containing protein [Streptomyces viridochromogenes]
MAIYQKLTASSALMALATGVFDEVPEDQAFPYVSFGSIVETKDDTHDRQGLFVTVVIHVWSKYPGNREAADIFSALDAALDRQPLAVAGFKDVSIWHEQHETLRDPDPSIRHINAQYRVRLTRL